MFKLLNDGASGCPNILNNLYTDIFSITISLVSVLYGFASYNMFQLYQNKEVSSIKVLKFACFNILHYCPVIIVNLYSASCAMLVSLDSMYNNNYEIVNSPNCNTGKLTKLSENDFALVLLAYFITFINNVIIISIVVFKDENHSCCFVITHFLSFIKKLFGELMYDANIFVNPYNMIYRGKRRMATTDEKLLHIRKNCALTLLCFSIVMSVCCASVILQQLSEKDLAIRIGNDIGKDFQVLLNF